MAAALVSETADMMAADRETLVRDFLTALLSVNLWSLPKTVGLQRALGEAGLFNFDLVRTLDTDEVAHRLHQAGYSRGMLNYLIAGRVIAAASTLSDERLDQVGEWAKQDRIADVEGILRTINGVGPVVLAQFWTLYRQKHEGSSGEEPNEK